MLHDSLRDPGRKRDAINMSLSSAFCWVPRGQGQGDPTRHMVALFHGCVPVFSLGGRGCAPQPSLQPSTLKMPYPHPHVRAPHAAGRRRHDDALPFEELCARHRSDHTAGGRRFAGRLIG